MNVTEYLKRLRYNGSITPSVNTLNALQRAHLRHVPFENLDIPFGRTIELSLAAQYQKVVKERRGGFCFELNSLFYTLLIELGFKAQMLAAKVFDGEEYGPEFDHLLLLVDVEQQQYIVDVGFGDSATTPLRLYHSHQSQESGCYQLRADDDEIILFQAKHQESAKPQYRFTLKRRTLSDFEPMCHYHQTSPQSVFTQKQLCTKLTENGRVTLSNGKLINSIHDKSGKSETTIQSEEQYRQLLADTFEFDLSIDLPLNVLVLPGHKT